MDKFAIAKALFRDILRVYIYINFVNLIYIIISFVKSKPHRKSILSARLIYIFIIFVIGYFFSEYCTTLVDYDDVYLAEGIGWFFLFYVLPAVFGISLINFIIIKFLGNFIKFVLDKYAAGKSKSTD